MNTTEMDPRTAELMEAARDLLHLSLSLNGSGTTDKPWLPKHHVIYSAAALSCLLHGNPSQWSDYCFLGDAVVEQEGIN